MTTTEQQIREARRWAGTIASGYGAHLVTDLADALERQQDVVEAARGYGRGEFGWPRRLEKALAALDAPPEGEGT